MTPLCQSCGSDEVNTVSSSNQRFTALCELCTKLSAAGLLRADVDDHGRIAYRQWHQNWSPGELLPHVEQPWEKKVG